MILSTDRDGIVVVELLFKRQGRRLSVKVSFASASARLPYAIVYNVETKLLTTPRVKL